MSLRDQLASIYPPVGLSAEWSVDALQLSSNVVLLDMENEGRETWQIAVYKRDADGDIEFFAPVLTGTLVQCCVLISEVEDFDWNNPDCHAAPNDASVEAKTLCRLRAFYRLGE